MSDLCINCSQRTTIDGEFCDLCLTKMEQGVEMSMHATDRKLVDTRRNVLFQTTKVTGNMIEDDEDIIAHRHRNDEEDNYYFWMVIVVVIFLMTLIVVLN